MLAPMLAIAAPSSAALDLPDQADERAYTATTRGATGSDDICVQMRRADKVPVLPGDCQLETTVHVSEPVLATAEELQQAPVDEAGGITLLALPTAYCKTWWQTQGSGAWQEKHEGKFCYNYRNVWVWNAVNYPNKDGWHYCDRGYGIGYDIEVQACTEKRVSDTSVPDDIFMQNWDRYHVHVIWQGLPMYFSHDMHANVFTNGNVTFHN